MAVLPGGENCAFSSDCAQRSCMAFGCLGINCTASVAVPASAWLYFRNRYRGAAAAPPDPPASAAVLRLTLQPERNSTGDRIHPTADDARSGWRIYHRPTLTMQCLRLAYQDATRCAT